jgi:hypothetical protein
MKTICLRASLPASLLLVLLAAASTAAQTATDVPTGPTLASQVAPLAGVRTAERFVPLGSSAADDDQRRPADPQPAGPMTVVPVRHAFVVAPEVRFGKVNHRSATFAGATAGLLMDNRLFLGAGGYWLANSRRGFEMGYVGAVAGWYLRGDGPIDLRISGLIGGGWSTMTWVGGPVPLGMDGRMHQIYPQPPGDSLVRAWYVGNDFFIAEPEANLCIRISRSVWLDAGVGYRFISGAYGLDNDMRGVTGSVAVTFGRR